MLTTTVTLDRKSQLQAKIDGLEIQIRAIDDQLRQGFHYGNDLADMANAQQERDNNLAILQLLQQKLWQLKYALARLDTGSDGDCEICGGKIDPARMEAVPEATLCVNCQRRTEQRG